MPAKKGGKKKGKKNSTVVAEKRQLLYKNDYEEYAKITKSLGDRKMTVILPDTSEMLAVIPGRFRKRCWMNIGDVVLISRREFQVEKVDIIYKYNPDEIRTLNKEKEIPNFFVDTEIDYNDNPTDDGLFIDSDTDEENNIKQPYQSSRNLPSSDDDDEEQNIKFEDI